MAIASPYLRPEPQAAKHLWVVVALGLVAFAAACGYALALGELQAFFVALSVVGALGVLLDFRIGAVLLVMMLPLGATHVFPHSLFGLRGVNPLNMLLVATLLSYLLRGRLAELVPRPLLWLYLVPIGLAGLFGMRHVHDIAPAFFEEGALDFAGALGYLRDIVVRPLLIVVGALLVGMALARSDKPERFIKAIMASVWIIALIVLGYIALSGVPINTLAYAGSRDFYDALGMHANDVGRIFAVAYALLLFVWWDTRSPGLKSALFVTLGVVSLGLVLSFSRAAFLAFFLTNALFLLWRANVKSVGLALIAGVLAAAIAPEYVYNRITFGFDGGANEVSADRIEGLWLPLLPELAKSPLWGSGIGSIMWSEPVKFGIVWPVTHPHNAYLEALLDMGIVGLALLLAYYRHVWRGFRALGSNAYLSPEMRAFFQGASAALICFFVTGISGSTLRPDAEFAYLWMAIGMMYGMLARRPAG